MSADPVPASEDLSTALVVSVGASAANAFEKHKKFSSFRKRKRSRMERKGEEEEDGEGGEAIDITISLGDITPEQAVKNVVDAKDHFEVLRLPPPVLNDIGQTLWPVMNKQLKEHFKQLSLLTHPDKHPNLEDAGRAFEILTNAFRTLTDSSLREPYIKGYIEAVEDPERPRGWAPTTDVSSQLKEELALAKKASEAKFEEANRFRSQLNQQIKVMSFDRRRKEELAKPILDSDSEDEDAAKNKKKGGSASVASVHARKRHKKALFF